MHTLAPTRLTTSSASAALVTSTLTHRLLFLRSIVCRIFLAVAFECASIRSAYVLSVVGWGDIVREVTGGTVGRSKEEARGAMRQVVVRISEPIVDRGQRWALRRWIQGEGRERYAESGWEGEVKMQTRAGVVKLGRFQMRGRPSRSVGFNVDSFLWLTFAFLPLPFGFPASDVDHFSATACPGKASPSIRSFILYLPFIKPFPGSILTHEGCNA